MATRLREVRLGRGMKQKDVARALGIDVSNYCKIENGAVPSPETARRIVRYFSPDESLTEMHILYPQDYVAEESRTS